MSICTSSLSKLLTRDHQKLGIYESSRLIDYLACPYHNTEVVLHNLFNFLQYSAPYYKSQHFFERFCDFFCKIGAKLGIFTIARGKIYPSIADFMPYLSIVAHFLNFVNDYYAIFYGVCQIINSSQYIIVSIKIPHLLPGMGFGADSVS